MDKLLKRFRRFGSLIQGPRLQLGDKKACLGQDLATGLVTTNPQNFKDNAQPSETVQQNGKGV